MRHTAKLFMNGRSQALRLPVDYRFDCEEVFIRRDPETGDIILSRKPGSWQDFFEMMDNEQVPVDFMSDRDNAIAEEKDLF
ncbi:MAG TPA: AbrB family transcriptional regulator [Gammaproteobacteria bacterium]|nr:type II toxin-antitoxin system VapB family antitoxin [Pseudomonadota bacterium]HBF09954.1 AbrB family transcriptional regulator [Gammaproteobacteria bacterium]HCK91509.1 AbrB family transcriptional regulator [Gammaproteobacteria bacterium]|tara:strand:+ start:1031 stop:1273 length:243 start_codon:yes stop_codon:yes gene_type:complete